MLRFISHVFRIPTRTAIMEPFIVGDRDPKFQHFFFVMDFFSITRKVISGFRSQQAR